MLKSRLLVLAAALLAGFAAPALAQQGTVKIILGYPAGASSDILTRIVADHMRVTLGQSVIVENKPGAGGRIGNETVKQAAPDGTTLLMTPVATMAIFPHSFGNLRYDPFKDFDPVTHLADFQLALGVAARIPAKTLAEYVALVKQDSKNGFYASAAGEIAAATTLSADIGSLVKADKARLLAVSGDKRDPAFPNVPTFKESGFDMSATGWYGLFAPAGTPAATVDRLSKAAIAAIKDPAVNQRLVGMGLDPSGYDAATLAKVLKADFDKWGPIIKASGFKPGG